MLTTKEILKALDLMVTVGIPEQFISKEIFTVVHIEDTKTSTVSTEMRCFKGKKNKKGDSYCTCSEPRKCKYMPGV